MCARKQAASPEVPPFLPPPPEGALGIPREAAQEELRPEVYKELINKLAWALGSTYRVNYSSNQMPARKYANELVGKIIFDHGFPRHTLK